MVESEKSGLPWSCLRELGWWREQTGWRPGPTLWLQQKPLGPPDRPLDIVPAGTGRWIDSPGPYSSSSSSLLECEVLVETRVDKVNFHFILTVNIETKVMYCMFSYTSASAETEECTARSPQTPLWLGGYWQQHLTLTEPGGSDIGTSKQGRFQNEGFHIIPVTLSSTHHQSSSVDRSSHPCTELLAADVLFSRDHKRRAAGKHFVQLGPWGQHGLLGRLDKT